MGLIPRITLVIGGVCYVFWTTVMYVTYGRRIMRGLPLVLRRGVTLMPLLGLQLCLAVLVLGAGVVFGPNPSLLCGIVVLGAAVIWALLRVRRRVPMNIVAFNLAAPAVCACLSEVLREMGLSFDRAEDWALRVSPEGRIYIRSRQGRGEVVIHFEIEEAHQVVRRLVPRLRKLPPDESVTAASGTGLLFVLAGLALPAAGLLAVLLAYWAATEA